MPRATRLPSIQGAATTAAARERILVYVRRLLQLPPSRPESRALIDWLRRDPERVGIALPVAVLRHPPSRRMVRPQTWAELQASIASRHVNSRMSRPFRPLAEALGLNRVAESILQIAADYRSSMSFMELWDALAAARGLEAMLTPHPQIFSALLGVTEAEVAESLRPDGPLRAAGLLVAGEDNQLSLLPRIARLAAEPMPQMDVRATLLGPAAKPALPLSAFEHLGACVARTVALLQGAVGSRCPGIHVLLYGPPGTGKTSLAASLAAATGAPLHEVALEGPGGEELSGAERLAELRLAQRLLQTGQPALLLFDEAEDVFASGFASFLGHRSERSRAFIHRLLETGAAPVIWTANNPDMLGPAVLRRMACCLELRVPPVPVRQRMWGAAAEAEGLALKPEECADLARNLPTAPAIMRTASRTARLAGGGSDVLRWSAEGIATVMAGGRPPPPGPWAESFDPRLINSDTDLATLADRLAGSASSRRISLLLSGPPGSGKTAYAYHLADRLGLPILQRRGSDLLGCFVGQTEKQIAAAFAEARDTGAMLLFDEVDGLLGDRAGANASWEVSQVNEMLTWMEHHPVPFCCTTNLPERLDPAAMRRFLVKARFGWLTREQAELAWRLCFASEPPAGLAALDRLTPADFALVCRAAEAVGTSGDAAALLGALMREQQAKPGAGNPIGFVSDG